MKTKKFPSSGNRCKRFSPSLFWNSDVADFLLPGSGSALWCTGTGMRIHITVFKYRFYRYLKIKNLFATDSKQVYRPFWIARNDAESIITPQWPACSQQDCFVHIFFTFCKASTSVSVLPPSLFHRQGCQFFLSQKFLKNSPQNSMAGMYKLSCPISRQGFKYLFELIQRFSLSQRVLNDGTTDRRN